MTKEATDETKIALINNNIGFIQKDISEIKSDMKSLGGAFATTVALREVAASAQERFDKLEKSQVTLETFQPIQRIVYGLVGLILVAVVGALISLVVRS